MIKNNWTKHEISEIYNRPLLDLIFEAAKVHRQNNDYSEVQISSLISIKTGGCPEDCAYCPQAARYATDVNVHKMMQVDEVVNAAKAAKEGGSSRLCMGAAWREVRDNRDFDKVLEMVKGTAWWPPLSAWDGAILFYETSEDAPAPGFVRYWLRNFAAQGILGRLGGLLLARPDPGGDPTYRARLEVAIMETLAEEGRSDLPVLSGLDFGHTSPMLTLPYGVRATIDCEAASLIITEAGVV